MNRPPKDITEAGNTEGGKAAGAGTAFIKQSTWMITATFAGGLFMFGVHVVILFMPEEEYGLFGALLQVLNLMMIPALGLQSVFARQAAAAIDGPTSSALRATTRTVLAWGFWIWLASAAVAFLFRHEITSALRITNPAALWMTVLLGLPQLWAPVTMGLLQGRQDFGWLGWAGIANGMGRFAAIMLIVVVLGGHAAGAITGAWIGLMVGFGISAWRSRATWSQTGTGFQARQWLAEIVPLTLGLGASQFMLAIDLIVVRMVFDSQTGLYGAAGMMGRGLVTFTAPVAVVVFPKIVRNLAQSKNSNVLWQGLLATAALGGLAALGCTLGSWMLPWMLDTLAQTDLAALASIKKKILGSQKELRIVADLVPAFMWSMLPFALANILIYNLLARRYYRAIPWLVLVALAYATALLAYHPTFHAVIRLITVFSLTLLAVAAGFSLRAARATPQITPPNPGT